MSHQATSQKSTDPFTPGWIDEGLIYRGDAPPEPVKRKEWKADDWIYLPHESYIPISKSRVLSALSAELTGANTADFSQLVRILEGVYHFHYHELLNQLKDDYEYFAPWMGSKMREGVSPAELKERERRLMVNFTKLMVRGNFNPLSDAEQRHASSHTYLLDLPVEVNLNIQDPGLITDFLAYSKTPEGRAQIAESAQIDDLTAYLQPPKAYEERMLLFHRGIKTDRVEGLFLLQKLNHLMDRLFELVFKPVEKGVKTVEGRTEQLVDGAVNLGVGAVRGAVDLSRAVISGRPFAPRPKRATQQRHAAEAEARSESRAPDDAEVVFVPRWLRRKSLQNQRMSLKGFFSSSLLQEPAMERVVCLFRLYPPSPPPFLTRLPVIGRFIKVPPPGSVDPTIYIKLFQNVPLADLELVFPEKHIRMKPFDKFMLYFLGFIGLVMGVIKVTTDAGGKGGIVALFSLLGLLAFKTITRFINTRRRYLLQMSQDLYNKNLDNDIGVVQYLVDSIEDQELKEALIAYTLLLKAGRPLTEEELDEAAERFLNTHFKDLEVDFEVDDALEKLCVPLNEQGVPEMSEAQARSTMFLPIIRASRGADGLTRYEALPMREALRLMDEKWDNFFKYA